MAEPLPATFGGRLRHFRKSLGVRQQDLATAIGVTRQTLINYESGIVSPSLDAVQAIAATLGLAYIDLLPPVPDPPSGRLPAQPISKRK